MNLSIQDDLTGSPGGIVKVPIFIDNAAGVQSLTLTLNYDTDILDVIDPVEDTETNEAIRRTGISEDWVLTTGEGDNPDAEANFAARVDDEKGEIEISLFNPTNEVTPAGEGNIVEIDFSISADAPTDSTATIDLQEARLGIDGETNETVLGDSLLGDGTVIVGVGSSLDVDGDGTIGALTDGLMVFGYLTLKDIPVPGIFSQLDSLIQPDAIRTDGEQVANYLESLGDSLDADGDGTIGALTDGLMVFGYLTLKDIPVPGIFSQLDSLIQPDAIRTDGEQVANYLESFIPDNI